MIYAHNKITISETNIWNGEIFDEDERFLIEDTINRKVQKQISGIQMRIGYKL